MYLNLSISAREIHRPEHPPSSDKVTRGEPVSPSAQNISKPNEFVLYPHVGFVITSAPPCHSPMVAKGESTRLWNISTWTKPHKNKWTTKQRRLTSLICNLFKSGSRWPPKHAVQDLFVAPSYVQGWRTWANDDVTSMSDAFAIWMHPRNAQYIWGSTCTIVGQGYIVRRIDCHTLKRWSVYLKTICSLEGHQREWTHNARYNAHFTV